MGVDPGAMYRVGQSPTADTVSLRRYQRNMRLLESVCEATDSALIIEIVKAIQ